MAIASTSTRRVLVCRSVNDANRGGTLEDVDVAALRDAFGSLKLLEPPGAAQIEDASVPEEPNCPTTMPKSCRLLLVRHGGEFVGVVVHTFKGGAQGQQDGIISQASGNPADRSNLESFFRS